MLVRGQEDLGGVTIFLLAKQGFAKPEMRVGRATVFREARDMVAEPGLSGAIVAGQDELVGIAIEFVRVVGRR